jgi:hypothetical protein
VTNESAITKMAGKKQPFFDLKIEINIGFIFQRNPLFLKPHKASKIKK